jgi:hypothetical protein
VISWSVLARECLARSSWRALLKEGRKGAVKYWPAAARD